jgi:hypothetical protein
MFTAFSTLEAQVFSASEAVSVLECQHTGLHVNSGVDRANLLLLVVTTLHVKRSMALVLESSDRASESHRSSND